jgi:hypothetical protein
MTDNERSPDERSDIREWPILGNHRPRVAQGCPGKIFAGRAASFLPLPARGGSIGRLRRPFLEKDAEAKLRLWSARAG